VDLNRLLYEVAGISKWSLDPKTQAVSIVFEDGWRGIFEVGEYLIEGDRLFVWPENIYVQAYPVHAVWNLLWGHPGGAMAGGGLLWLMGHNSPPVAVADYLSFTEGEELGENAESLAFNVQATSHKGKLTYEGGTGVDALTLQARIAAQTGYASFDLGDDDSVDLIKLKEDIGADGGEAIVINFDPVNEDSITFSAFTDTDHLQIAQTGADVTVTSTSDAPKVINLVLQYSSVAEVPDMAEFDLNSSSGVVVLE